MKKKVRKRKIKYNKMKQRKMKFKNKKYQKINIKKSLNYSEKTYFLHYLQIGNKVFKNYLV